MTGNKKVKFSDLIPSTDEELDLASVNESPASIKKVIKKAKKAKKTKKEKKAKKTKKEKKAKKVKKVKK